MVTKFTDLLATGHVPDGWLPDTGTCTLFCAMTGHCTGFDSWLTLPDFGKIDVDHFAHQKWSQYKTFLHYAAFYPIDIYALNFQKSLT